MNSAVLLGTIHSEPDQDLIPISAYVVLKCLAFGVALHAAVRGPI